MSLNHHADAASPLDRAIEATRRLTAASNVPPRVIARAQSLAASGYVVPRNVEPTPPSMSAPHRTGRIRRTLLQVALTLALLAGVGVAATLSGLLQPTSAFAAAVEQVRKMSVVRFVAEVNHAGTVIHSTHIHTAGGIGRLEYDGSVVLMDFRAGKMVLLVPAERKASVLGMEASDRPDQDFFECFEAIAPNAGKPQGRERVDGIDTEVFKVTDGGSTQTFWINPTTRLPVRITHRCETADGAMTITQSGFEWDPAIDPALLAVAIPDGYVRPDIDPSGQEIDIIAAGVADFLRLCTEVDGGRLPDDLSRASVTAFANRLAANPMFADKTDRVAAALGGLGGLQIGLELSGEKLHYLGKGRQANDGKGIVVWYTRGKTTTAINDDFATRTIAPNDVPALPKAE